MPCGKFVHNLGFGGNGMYGPYLNPAGVLAFHTGTAYKDILDGIKRNVPSLDISTPPVTLGAE